MQGYHVTLTTLNTNYNLLTLVLAINSSFVDQGDIVVQVDGVGADVVLLGGSDLDATHYGSRMLPGDFSPHFKSLQGINARSDTSGTKLNISVVK